MGDGAFAMSMAEIETAVREKVHLVVLVWVDGGYGLIGWKQDRHFGRQAAVSFTNPDFVRLAESFGAKGYEIGSAAELAPTLRKALDDEAVSIVACPVDYAENGRLIERLGALTDPI
jgi:acetolactate synthase-1/2/3 large subunit